MTEGRTKLDLRHSSETLWATEVVLWARTRWWVTSGLWTVVVFKDQLLSEAVEPAADRTGLDKVQCSVRNKVLLALLTANQLLTSCLPAAYQLLTSSLPAVIDANRFRTRLN